MKTKEINGSVWTTGNALVITIPKKESKELGIKAGSKVKALLINMDDDESLSQLISIMQQQQKSLKADGSSTTEDVGIVNLGYSGFGFSDWALDQPVVQPNFFR